MTPRRAAVGVYGMLCSLLNSSVRRAVARDLEPISLIGRRRGQRRPGETEQQPKPATIWRGGPCEIFMRCIEKVAGAVRAVFAA